MSNLDEALITHGSFNDSLIQQWEGFSMKWNERAIPVDRESASRLVRWKMMKLSPNSWMTSRRHSYSSRITFPPSQSETASSTSNAVLKPPYTTRRTNDGRKQMKSSYMLTLRIWQCSSNPSRLCKDHLDHIPPFSFQQMVCHWRRRKPLFKDGRNISAPFLTDPVLSTMKLWTWLLRDQH